MSPAARRHQWVVSRITHRLIGWVEAAVQRVGDAFMGPLSDGVAFDVGDLLDLDDDV